MERTVQQPRWAVVVVSDSVKSDRSQELYDLATSALARFGTTKMDAHQAVFDLADLVDALPHLTILASEFGQRLTDTESVDGRVRLLSLLTAIRSLLQLEICKHAESFARLSEGVEDSLREKINVDGISDEELSRRLLVLAESRSRKPKR